MIIDKTLNNVIDTYWDDFQTKRNFADELSIPIIWFGDLKKYIDETNKIKIVTVSINPSNSEFKDDSKHNSFWRFKGIDTEFASKRSLCNEDKQILSDAYNSYFYEHPYDYFNCYEKVLNHFDCSYYGNRKNSAIHIDLYTPIATKKLWKNLSKKEKSDIQCFQDGSRSEDLVLSFLDGYLKPDIIFYSTQKIELKKVFKIDLNHPLHKETAYKGFNIELYQRPNSNQFILYGRNNFGRPFQVGDSFIKDVIDNFKDKIKELRPELII